MSTLFRIQIRILISKGGKLDGKPIIIGQKYGDRKAVLIHNVDEGHYYAVIAPYNTNKNYTMLNNMKRYVDGHTEPKRVDKKDEPKMDKKNVEDKDKQDKPATNTDYQQLHSAGSLARDVQV